MKKIFEDTKEPLFGRANNKFNLKSFTVDTIKVKRQAKKLDKKILQEKAIKLVFKHKKYSVDYIGYSLDLKVILNLI